MKESEIEQIISDTRRAVLSAVLRYLNPAFSYAVDDVVQEAYVKALQSLRRNRLKDKEKAGGWMYTIAKNEALRMNRRFTREQMKAEKKAEQTVFETEESDPVEHEELYAMIHNLDEKYRSVIQLKIEGLAEKEIGQRLSIAPGTVKSRLSRAREQIGRMLNEQP